MDFLTPPLPLLTLTYSLAVVCFAGVVRGFAGFGFSAVTVAGVSLVVSPALVVPAVFILEILASLTQLRGVAAHIDRAWFRWLAIGNIVCVPIGVAMLVWLPDTLLRLVIGLLLIGVVVALRLGRDYALPTTPGLRLFGGLMSGFINGVAAIGGIALASLLSAVRMPPATMRATMIAFLLVSDVVALICAALLPAGDGAMGIVTIGTAQWAFWLFWPMLAGIWVGQRSFSGASPEQFRRYVLNLLMVLAVVSVLRAGLGLLA